MTLVLNHQNEALNRILDRLSEETHPQKRTLVGVRGFEPPTHGSRSRYSTRLSYTPTEIMKQKLFGAVGENRTPDLLITIQALCH